MDTKLNLVVIRAAELERSQRFYEALGLRFSHEQHGRGPEFSRHPRDERDAFARGNDG